MEQLPDGLARQAVTHASWVDERSDAYERLAFLGDSVLGLAVTTHLFPRLESYGAGRLTKIRAQAVSGRSCREVAERLGIEIGQAHRAADDAVAAGRVLLAFLGDARIPSTYAAFVREQRRLARVHRDERAVWRG